ncbi:MAG: ABC transporter ATP-binding protein [Planctomycetota bacterium]|nr:ABC transporter ATP-binding protein [Planctomycetota bacterium]
MTTELDAGTGKVAAKPAGPAPIIDARGLGRWYGEVVGLSDLTVQVPAGITGLVGPNGAGKSTFMKCVVGELRPQRGALRVLGLDPFANRHLYARMGFCPQQDALYDQLTAFQFVEHLLRIGGTPSRAAKEQAAQALERVHLADAMHRRCGTYSKGMRQRVRIAQAIAHSPEMIVLDEPLTGLDPVARHQMRQLFEQLAAEGSSLLVSSHVLHELQGLTERIVLIHRGRLLAQGSVREIRNLLSQHPRRVKVRAQRVRPLALALAAEPDVRAVRWMDDTSVLFETTAPQALLERLESLVPTTQPGILSLEVDDEDLEAVFDYLVA